MSTSIGGMHSVIARLWRLYPGAAASPAASGPPGGEEPDEAGPFYGVYVPFDPAYSQAQEKLHVYGNRADALAVVKEFKKARFKACNSRREAVAFALRGTDHVTDRSSGDAKNFGGDGGSLGSPTVGEKPSIFKQPKPQEMTQLRKSIEAGDIETVKRVIWENPRFLISSGDTPAILQEGSRYNALHVAAKSTDVEMCDLILSTIANVRFIRLLYSEEDVENAKTRANILLDLYLNMPDKAMNETPLHFASKFGARDVVELLVSFPQCCRTATNKYGERPKDIICQRAKDANKQNAGDILIFLMNSFYVPVLHCEDDTCQPVIGEPFSPGDSSVDSQLKTVDKSVLSPRMEIRALAGPMNHEDAVNFRKKWKTPPRSMKNRSCLTEPKFRLKDMEKGLEIIGRDLAQTLKIGWKEYWPFLDTFTDFSTEEGLNLLENYLKNKYIIHWSSSNSLNLSDSYQPSPRTPAEEKQFNFNEHVSGSPKATVELSPMSDLCVAFNACTLSGNENHPINVNPPKPKRISESKVPPNPEEEAYVQNMLNPGLCPYLCVEKACEVFAKRIILGLRLSPSPDRDLIVKCLKSEAKRLQQTVASYMDDPRFYSVDFHLIHSRLAQLVAQKLKCDNSFADDIEDLSAMLKDISLSCDVFSSDEDDTIIYRNSPKDNKDQYNKRRRGISVQIKCIVSNILKWLNDWKSDVPANNVCNEEECINIWADLFKCNCPWQTESFYRNCRKNASLKRAQIKNRDGSILSSSPKSGMDYISRRLRFDSDGDLIENENNIKISKPGKTKLSNQFFDECEEKKETSSSSGDDEEEEKYFTPISSRAGSPAEGSSGESDYEELDNKSFAKDVFIQGDKPTKMDNSVYNAIKKTTIDMKKHPNIYRWRHSIALYPQSERESWPVNIPENEFLDDIDAPLRCSFNNPENEFSDDIEVPLRCSFNIGHISNFGTSTPNRRIKNIYSFSNDENGVVTSTMFDVSTPKSVRRLENKSSDKIQNDVENCTVPLQVSKWLRITGPHSPRSSLSNRNTRSNVSFGF